MTKPRTPEEIAEEWFKIHDGMCVRSIDGQPHREHFLAALREAADAARREEREALRERLAGDVEHWKSESQKGPIPWSSNCDGSAHEARNLLAWLDARSRTEEPK